MKDGKVVQTAFRNVPSFLSGRDQLIHIQGLGIVKFDIAYGGTFYAIVEAAPLGLNLDESDYTRLIETGKASNTIMKALPIEHPFEPDLSFLYGTIFTGPPGIPKHHSRNVCIFAEGEVDRTATGSGVSARAALHCASGQLILKQPITIESILGSTMTVKAIARTKFAPHDAILPDVSGTSHYTGRNEFWIGPDAPLCDGFILR